VIRFLQAENVRPSEIQRRLVAVYGEHVIYRGADKSLARPLSQCILFDGENISLDARLVIYINSTNTPPIMIIHRISGVLISP
jgi:hypothetical protein